MPAADRVQDHCVQFRGTELAWAAGELAGASCDGPHQVGLGRAEVDIGGEPPGRALGWFAEVKDAGGQAGSLSYDGGEPVPERGRHERPGLLGEQSPAVQADDPAIVQPGVREVAATDRRPDPVRGDQDLGVGGSPRSTTSPGPGDRPEAGFRSAAAAAGVRS
jgi:hypothetical protein